MLMLKKGYYYLFYKLYMMLNSGEIKWMTEGRTYAILLIIGSLSFHSLTSYIAILINQKELLILNARIFYTVFFILYAIFNYILFLHNENWKKIIKSFSNMDKRKNLAGTIIVYSILFMIAIAWLYSMHLWTTD